MKALIAGAFALAIVTAVPASIYASTPQAAAVKPTDQTIDDQVESRIKNDSSLKKHTIVVTVDDGVVTLTGTVPTEAESVTVSPALASDHVPLFAAVAPSLTVTVALFRLITGAELPATTTRLVAGLLVEGFPF